MTIIQDEPTDRKFKVKDIGGQYGKPKDRQDAIRMLKELQGDYHVVYTSLSILIEDHEEYKEYKELSKIYDFDYEEYSSTFFTSIDKQKIYKEYKALEKLNDSLNNKEEVEGMYKGEITINDSIFYQSGISAIALESLFNGPYLYSNVPSLIGEIFDMVGGNDLIPLEPSKVGGMSYPVKVKLTGSTNFYDYKIAKNIDISGLINENISEIAAQEAVVLKQKAEATAATNQQLKAMNTLNSKARKVAEEHTAVIQKNKKQLVTFKDIKGVYYGIQNSNIRRVYGSMGKRYRKKTTQKS